jgi:RHS repeat-associated protein
MAELTIPSGLGSGNYVVTWNGHGDATSLNSMNADGSLTVANTFSYSTWGVPTTTVAGGGSDLAFRFLYVGSGDVQWDKDFGLGLGYMHARHYAPGLGRFMQPDPVRLEENPFTYSRDNPVTSADPGGLATPFGRINSAEWNYCMDHDRFFTGVCQKWLFVSAWASIYAQKIYPNSPRNGKQDAFRHCIWQSHLVAYIGLSYAVLFGRLHEQIPNNPENEYRMDTYNNIAGRYVGRVCPGWNRDASTKRVTLCYRLVEQRILIRYAEG